MNNIYFEMNEAAEFLKISPETIKEWLKTRSPHNFRDYCTQIGRRRIITHENMERYLNDLTPKHKLEVN